MLLTLNRFFIHFILLAMTLSSLVVAKANDSFIYLPPEKNGFVISPPIFEYEVWTDGSIRIGSRKVSPKDIQFGITASNTKIDSPNFVIVWPANFFARGEVSILDGLDRALWSKKIDLSKRSASARKLTIEATPNLIKDLLRTSFFRFCAGAQSETSRLEVCTPEMTLAQVNGQFRLTTLNSTKPFEASANGKPLGSAGEIPLENPTDSIRVEINTAKLRISGFLRKPLFDFYHVLGDSKGGYDFYVKGGTPETPKEHESLGDNRWLLHLSSLKDRLYLSDNSQIPLAIEVGFKNTTWPSENISINQSQPKKTYFKSLLVKGDGIEEEISLNSGTEQSYPIQVNLGQTQLKGRLDAIAYKSFIADAGLSIPGNLRGIWFHGQAQKWLYPWLGGKFLAEPRIYHRNPNTSWDFYELSSLHRLNGYMFQQPGMGIKLNYAFMKVADNQYTLPGVGIFLHQRSFKLPRRFYDWHELTVDYYPDQTVNNIDLTSHFSARLNFFRLENNEKNYFKVSLGFRTFQYGHMFDGLENFYNIGYGIYL